MVKDPPDNTEHVRDACSIPGSRRSPGGGHGNPLRYSCLENLLDRRSWQATVHRVTKILNNNSPLPSTPGLLSVYEYVLHIGRIIDYLSFRDWLI